MMMTAISLNYLTTREATRIQYFFWLDIKYGFFCGEPNLYQNLEKFHKIMFVIAGALLFISV